MPIYKGAANIGQIFKGASVIGQVTRGARVVFQNIKQIYPAAGIAVQNLTTNSGTFSLADFRTTVNSGTNQNSTALYIAVDLTDVNTIVVTGSFSVTSVAGYAGCWASSAAQFNSSQGNLRYPYYTVGPGASTNYYLSMRRINNTTGTRSTMTLDVKGITGIGYIFAGCYYNNSAGGTATADIDTITVFKEKPIILQNGVFMNGYGGTYRGNLNGNTGYNPFSYAAGTGIKYEGGLSGNNTRRGNVYINQRVKVDRYNTITFKFNTSGAAWGGNTGWASNRLLQFGLASATGSATAAPTFAASRTINSGTTLSESYTIDISGLTGSYYISIWTSLAAGAYQPYYITDIILA